MKIRTSVNHIEEIIFGMKKTKAILQIILAISIIFAISINFREVTATTQEQQTYCCVEDNQGNLCQQYESKGHCKQGTLEYAGSCSQLAPCKPGCCDLTSSDSTNYQDVNCYPNTGIQTCNSQHGTWKVDGNCQYSQCQQGCCIVGTQCQLATKNACTKLTNVYPDLQLNYNQDITNEIQCLDQCQKQQTGCCVVNSQEQGQNNECKRTTGEECQAKNGNFRDGQLCSSITEKCGQCKPKSYLACVEWSDQVYWYDSCGNPETPAKDNEQVAIDLLNQNTFKGECDYAKGTKCKDAFYKGKNNKPQAGCISLNCADTWDNPYVDENGDCKTLYPDGKVPPNDPCWTNDKYSTDNPRKNGESWCEYQGNVGPGLDLPGSRHYKHYCENGQEQVEECKDMRDEICVQSNIVDGAGNKVSTTAACIPNRAIDCASQKTKDTCENVAARDCLWISSGDETYAGANKILKDYNREITPPKEEKGICAPIVPPGTQFWNNDNKYCDQVDSNDEGLVESVNTQWVGEGSVDTEWNCKGGCDAFTRTFSYKLNELCNSYGDCGAKYNLAAQWTSDGYKRLFEVNKGKFQLTDGTFSADPGDVDDGTIKNYDYEDIQGYDDVAKGGQCDLDGDNCARALIRAGESNNILKNDKSEGNSQFKYFLDNYHNYKEILQLKDISTNDVYLKSAKIKTVAKGIVMALLYTPLTVISIVLTIINWPSKDTVPITVDCNSWQAPYSSSNCNLCQEAGTRTYLVSNKNDCPGTTTQKDNEIICTEQVDLTAGGKHKCTEYLCKSLGSGCEFTDTNDGTKCLDSCKLGEDIRPVYISPKKDILTTDLNQMCTNNDQDSSGIKSQCVTDPIIGKINGVFEIKDTIKANSNLDITLQTCKDESCTQSMYANCKWDLEKKTNIDEMKYDFQETGFSDYHTLNLKANVDLISGQEKNIYVLCKNRCGYPDSENPYYEVKIKVAKAVRTQPPGLLDIQPPNNGFIPNNKLNSELDPFKIQMTFDEPVRQCKYDKNNLDFDRLTNTALCPFPLPQHEQTCFIPLLNLNEGDNIYFIKCKDQAGNTNKQNIPDNSGYKITGTKKLEIESTKCIQNEQSCGESNTPSGQFTVSGTNFTLQVSTLSGVDNGNSICKMTSWLGNIDFFDTGKTIHNQLITQQTGTPLFETFECTDKIGNTARGNFTYTLSVDYTSPKITKIYSEQGKLYVETNEKATCKYSNEIGNLNYDSSTIQQFENTGELIHTTEINNINYFNVICRDTNNNDITSEIYVK